jgi:hypothetical protein
MQEPAGHSSTGALETVLFLLGGAAAFWLAYLVLVSSLHPGWQLLMLVPFWLLVAYLALPRLHRVLTYLYVPGYFIGRTRTSDGLLGDPVNLALQGSEPQVHAAMAAAGWTRADEVTVRSSVRITTATLSGRPYPEAPVSPLYLFDRRQDFAYQQDVAGKSSQRHHVRFWRCPEGWRLPGGYAVDWLAAGTFDRSVGLSLMTFQVTHRIALHIDVERDHIVRTLTACNPKVDVEPIRHFSTGYHARNGGGDMMITDGDLPVVDLRAVDAQVDVPEPAEGTAPPTRPASTTFSAAVASLRGLVGAASGALLLLDPDGTVVVDDPAALSPAAARAVGVVLLVAGAVDMALGVATFLGRNWARLVLMLGSALAISLTFLNAVSEGPLPTLTSGLPVAALSVLVLLALTSPASRAYAQPGRRAARTRQGRSGERSPRGDGRPPARRATGHRP